MNTSKQTRFLKEILTSEEFYALKQDLPAFQQALAVYDEAYIDSVIVVAQNNHRFLITKKDQSKLLPTWKNTLEKLSLQENLQNPVYIQVEENGTMLID